MKKSLIILPMMSIFLLQSASALCTVADQNDASFFHKKSRAAEFYTEQIKFLKASLDTCYSSEVSAEKYLAEGDSSFDNGNYKEAKNYYNQIMQEVDNIDNPKVKQTYQLYYYKSMKEVFQKLGMQDQADTMKQKYDMVNTHKQNETIHTSYVDSASIYKQLAPSSMEKESYLRGMGVVERQINLSINFDYDSSRLSTKGRRQAHALGEAARRILGENRDGRMEIIGYTDTSGRASYNFSLSKRRASSIKKFLLQQYGVRRSQLSYRGRGESKPICPNSDYREDRGEYRCQGHEDKRASRRVEVRFILE